MRLQTNMIPNSCFPITLSILLHLFSSQEITCSLFNVTDFFFFIKTQGQLRKVRQSVLFLTKLNFRKNMCTYIWNC